MIDHLILVFIIGAVLAAGAAVLAIIADSKPFQKFAEKYMSFDDDEE